MSVSVTVRDVPVEVRNELAARAARAGQSLQEFLRSQLIDLARKPGPDDLWDRVARRVRVTGARLGAATIAELRGADRA